MGKDTLNKNKRYPKIDGIHRCICVLSIFKTKVSVSNAMTTIKNFGRKVMAAACGILNAQDITCH